MIQVLETLFILFGIVFIATLSGTILFEKVKQKRQKKKSTDEDTENNLIE